MTVRMAFVLFTALLFGCSSSKEFSFTAVESEIIPVRQWGGTPAVDSLAKKHSIAYITLHHAGVPFGKDKDILQYMKNLQNWSRREKKWIDLPYHYVIDLEGKIYEGRNIQYAGDTNTEYDPSGHALIEVVGNFEEVEPNQEQLDAVVRAMTYLAVRYNVPVDSIRGHKDYSTRTSCPGKNLYPYLQNGFFKNAVANNLRSSLP